MIKYINLIVLLITVFLITVSLSRNVEEPMALPTNTKVVYILKPTVNYLEAENILGDFVAGCSQGRSTGYTVEIINSSPVLVDKQCY